ncbi:MAG: pyridoxal 5'-phosphate synthase glutaminase subunit PdxT [Aquiluna sp.]
MTVGVLALQGDVREHVELLKTLGADAIAVKTEEQLQSVDGLVIPGGESTTISKLLVIFGMLEPVRKFAQSKPVLGTCAGLILLSDSVQGRLPDQELIGGLPIEVSRNAYGGQTHSFEGLVEIDGKTERVAFIRAPKILDASKVEVIATFEGEPVAVSHGKIMGASFHPELTGSEVLHRLFLEQLGK